MYQGQIAEWLPWKESAIVQHLQNAQMQRGFRKFIVVLLDIGQAIENTFI